MKCGFCNNAIERGTEKIYVTKRGDVYYFCSGKCERNQLNLGRKARRVRWTNEYMKEKKARLKLLADREEEKKKPSKKKVKAEPAKSPKEAKSLEKAKEKPAVKKEAKTKKAEEKKPVKKKTSPKKKTTKGKK